MSWYEVTRFAWATKPGVEVRAAIARAARKTSVEVVEIEADDTGVDADRANGFEIQIVIASAGKFARLQLAADDTGAELVLDGANVDGEVGDEAMEFYSELAAELGGAAREDPAPARKIGPPRSVIYEAFDRDDRVVKRGDFPAKCLYDDNKTFAVLHDEGRVQLRVARVAFVETDMDGIATHRSEWRIDGYGRVVERTGTQGGFGVGGMRGR